MMDRLGGSARSPSWVRGLLVWACLAAVVASSGACERGTSGGTGASAAPGGGAGGGAGAAGGAQAGGAAGAPSSGGAPLQPGAPRLAPGARSWDVAELGFDRGSPDAPVR